MHQTSRTTVPSKEYIFTHLITHIDTKLFTVQLYCVQKENPCERVAKPVRCITYQVQALHVSIGSHLVCECNYIMLCSNFIELYV